MFNIDIERGNYSPLWNCGLGDTIGEEFRITRLGVPQTFTNPNTQLNVKKADGTFVHQEIGITYLDGVFTIDFDNECVTAPGVTAAELLIVENGRTTTSRFFFYVRKTLDSGIIDSFSKVQQLEELERYLDTAYQQISETVGRIEFIETNNINLNKQLNENEAAREVAEVNRNKAETDRGTTFNTLKSGMEQATSNAVNINNDIALEEERRIAAERQRSLEHSNKMSEAGTAISEVNATDATATQNEINRGLTFNQLKGNMESATNAAIATEREIAAEEVKRKATYEQIKKDETARGQAEASRDTAEKDRVLVFNSQREAFDAINRENEANGLGPKVRLHDEQIAEITQQFDSVVANVTNGNESATNSEIVLARKGEVNLGAKIGKIDSQLAEKANKSEIGSPLIANDINGMTDTSRVYVNATDGNWYSWNGTSWVIGGTYNSQGIGDKSIEPIKTSFINVIDNDISKNVAIVKGYLDTTTGVFKPSTNFETTEFIEMTKGIKYICEFSGCNNGSSVPSTSPRAIIIYNADKSFSRKLSIPADLTNGRLAIEGINEKYVRVNMLHNTNSLKIYPNTGHKIENILNNTVKVHVNNIVVDEEKMICNFIGRPRKPIISFILDGEYDMNSNMETIFSSKGFMVGFAPQYTTNWSSNPVSKYIEWQSKGHEILAHGNYVLNEGATYTEEEAKTIIQNSYNILTNLGFNINGFIGSSGFVAERYKKYVRDYYLYGATENNHSGSYSGLGADPCLYFKTDAPYKLWRYSIESSTLEQMKLAVDRAISTNGLLMFYGHARSTNINNFTEANLIALCDYIKSLNCTVLAPYEAIKEYYSIRYEDVVSSQ